MEGEKKMRVQVKFYEVKIIDARNEELEVIATLTSGDISEVGKLATEYLKENNLPKDKVWKTTPIVKKAIREVEL